MAENVAGVQPEDGLQPSSLSECEGRVASSPDVDEPTHTFVHAFVQ